MLQSGSTCFVKSRPAAHDGTITDNYTQVRHGVSYSPRIGNLVDWIKASGKYVYPEKEDCLILL
jgi:hypothetical protein